MNILRFHSLKFISDPDDDFLCRNVQYLSKVDRGVFWIDGLFTIIASSFLIFGSFRYKELRRQPGDLIIGIAFSDFIVSIYWLILGFSPCKFSQSTFGRVIEALGTFGSLTQYLYNLSFSIFLIINLRNALRQAKVPKLAFHIVNLTIAGIYLCALILRESHEKLLAKFYIFNFHNEVGPVLVAIYVLLGVFTYFYVERNLPTCARAHKKRTQFLRYYLHYNTASIIIYFIIAFPGISENFATGKTSEPFWRTSLYDVAKLCSPLMLSLFRYNDPTLKKFTRRALLFWKKGNVIPETETIGNDKPKNKKDSLDMDFIFNDLQSHVKAQLTYTLLACVLTANNMPTPHFERKESMKEINDEQKKNPYKHQKVYLVEEDAICESFPAIKTELEKQQYHILPGTLKIYSPEVFGGFVYEDRKFLDIAESLDFGKNEEEIKRMTDNDGGKSGEFFFFSHDKKLIIKTIPNTELNMMRSILGHYEQYHIDNKDSLIAKIYGVYTYENTDLGLTCNLILMKNICGLPSRFVKRAYDMKGSKYDREVLKGLEMVDETMLQQKVLKDIDFKKHEKHLDLPAEFRQKFLEQIRNDSKFFKRVGLIDYSLMVFIVDKQEDMDNFRSNNPLASIRSASDPNVYYRMGIVDYLQPYNFSKASERCLKRFKKLDPNLDTSSQDPVYYSQRFIKFIEELVEQKA